LSSLPSSYDSSNFDLCFLCHDESKLTTDTPGYTNYYDPLLYGNLHKWHLKDIGSGLGWAGNPGGVATCRICHYDTHSNQQATNTEYWYYDGVGNDIPGYPGWHKSVGSPVDSVKSHLVSFAPLVTTDISYLDPTFTKPAFRIWLVKEGSGLGAKAANSRECDLVCHGNNSTVITMDNGAGGAVNTLYKPPAAYDDSLTY
jgi:hypothetical protein